MFVDRQAELAFLNDVLTRQRPTPAQFLLLYGRRRVGKTVLLRHWAEQAGVSSTYWAAEKEPAMLQRRKLFARVLGVEPAQAATFDTWDACWQAIAAVLAGRRHILILDEFTYAAESDPAMLSSLQHAWDQQFKNTQVLLPFHRAALQRTALSRGTHSDARTRGTTHVCGYDGVRGVVPSMGGAAKPCGTIAFRGRRCGKPLESRRAGGHRSDQLA